jgi:hypothetical protein
MSRLHPYLRPTVAGAAIALLLGVAACEKKPEAPAPVAATPAAPADPAATAAATSEDSEHQADGPQSLEEARAEGHREGMEMERDAHERGMDMGARAHADGMNARGADAMPAKKADPPMKMDGHM